MSDMSQARAEGELLLLTRLLQKELGKQSGYDFKVCAAVFKGSANILCRQSTKSYTKHKVTS